MSSRRLIVQPQYCVGCRACEMACAFTHGHQGQPGSSRCLTMPVGKDEFVPMMCLQCAHSACVQVCPVRAIERVDATGVIVVDDRKCIRCMACTVACPFGNMHVDVMSSRVLKCDLCAGYGDNPRCAMFCPTKCLSVEVAE